VIRVVLLALLLLAVAWAFWRLMDGVIETFGGTRTRQGRSRPKAPPVKLVRDPVCGTWVSPTDARFLQVGSTTHFFCSDACRTTFQKRS
jgi:YHS domain-containing protein